MLSAAICWLVIFASAAGIAYSHVLLITQASGNSIMASSWDEAGFCLLLLAVACVSHIAALPSACAAWIELSHGGASITPGTGIAMAVVYLGLLWLVQSSFVLVLVLCCFTVSGGSRVGSIESLRSIDSSSARLSSLGTDGTSTLSGSATGTSSTDQWALCWGFLSRSTALSYCCAFCFPISLLGGQWGG